MNWFGSGFVPIIIYATAYAGGTENNSFIILTESSFNLEAETSQNLLTE